VFAGAHFSAKVSQNAEGLRDRHHPYDRTPGRRRILVLGDSFVWCWGVEHAECFTTLMEAALPDTDVVNAGVPAYSTAQEMLLYEREGRRYGADLVLLVVVPNDPWENVAGPGPRFRLDGERLVETNVPAPRRKGPALEWLQAHSRVFAHGDYLVALVTRSIGDRMAGWRALATVAPGDGTPSPPPQPALAATTPSRPDPSWAVTAALLDRLAADVQRDGARFALAFEAMPKPMREWLHGVCAARGIPCVDLGPALWAAHQRGEQVRLEGDPHVAPAGQRVVAATLLEFLAREGLLPDVGAAGR
jgi:hypothetical protein